MKDKKRGNYKTKNTILLSKLLVDKEKEEDKKDDKKDGNN